MTEQWKELRARNIGGSDIAALFNEHPYTTHYKIWHEKRGEIVPSETDHDRALAGKFLEPAIIEWANYKWGLDLYQPGLYVEHKSLKGMGCTPDAFSKSDPFLMAQIKNVDAGQFALKWEQSGETVTKAPLNILLQVHHEMEVCDKARSYLIVCVGGNRLYTMLVERDSETCEIILSAVRKFWESVEPPPPDFTQDGPTIKALRKRLPFLDFVDLSDDGDLYKILKQFQKIKFETAKRTDKLEAYKAEILHCAKQYKRFKCRNIVVSFDARDAMIIKDEEIRL